MKNERNQEPASDREIFESIKQNEEAFNSRNFEKYITAYKYAAVYLAATIN